jgi:hypothetical protein
MAIVLDGGDPLLRLAPELSCGDDWKRKKRDEQHGSGRSHAHGGLSA